MSRIPRADGRSPSSLRRKNGTCWAALAVAAGTNAIDAIAVAAASVAH
jgi:hypothetical protein